MYEDSEMSVRDMILNYLETTQASSNGVNEYWHFATGGRHFAWLRHGWDVGEAVGWAIKEGVSAGTCRCDVIARLCTSLSRWALSTCTLATSRHRAIEPDRIHAAKAHTHATNVLYSTTNIVLLRITTVTGVLKWNENILIECCSQ